MTTAHHGRRWSWRAGVLRHTWLVGVQYDFPSDAWLFHLGPLAIRIWRRR